jgi:hypothetical protein
VLQHRLIFGPIARDGHLTVVYQGVS